MTLVETDLLENGYQFLLVRRCTILAADKTDDLLFGPWCLCDAADHTDPRTGRVRVFRRRPSRKRRGRRRRWGRSAFVLHSLFQRLRVALLCALGGVLWGHGEEDGLAVGALFLDLEGAMAHFDRDPLVQLTLDGELARNICVEFEGDDWLGGGKRSQVELVGGAFFQGTHGVKCFTYVDTLE
jgi:hypothetical protein